MRYLMSGHLFGYHLVGTSPWPFSVSSTTLKTTNILGKEVISKSFKRNFFKGKTIEQSKNAVVPYAKKAMSHSMVSSSAQPNVIVKAKPYIQGNVSSTTPRNAGFYTHENVSSLQEKISSNVSPTVTEKSGEIVTYSSPSSKNNVQVNNTVLETVSNNLQVVTTTTNNTSSNSDISLSVLSSPNSLSVLPVSPVQPVYLTKQQFVEICAVGAAVTLIKKGASVEEIVILQNLLRGSVGSNVELFKFISNRIPALKAPLNMQKTLSSDILEHMPEELAERLKGVMLSGQQMFLYETTGLAKFNSNQEDQLIYAENKSYSNNVGCYNNSPNVNPDYVIKLQEPVSSYKFAAVDFKYMKKVPANRDLVRGCSDEVEKKTIEAHDNLIDQLDYLDEKIKLEDYAVLKSLKDDLESNKRNFALNGDVDSFYTSFNDLRPQYSDFLIRHNIGINMIIPISAADFALDAEVKTNYTQEFNSLYLSPDSKVLAHYNKAVQDANGVINHKHILAEYAQKFFDGTL